MVDRMVGRMAGWPTVIIILLSPAGTWAWAELGNRNLFLGQKNFIDKRKFESVQRGRLLKASIFVVQKAAAPKNGVEFCQRSIGVIRCSFIVSDVRRPATLLYFRPIRSFHWWVVGGWSTVSLVFSYVPR